MTALLLSILAARFLTPEEVGVLGLAVLVTSFVSMLAAYPVLAAIALDRRASEHESAAAATLLHAAVALPGCALTYAAMPWIATGVAPGASQATLVSLGQMLLAVPLLELAGVYPSVILQRRLVFGRLAKFQAYQHGAHTATAILLLTAGWRPFALVVGQLVGTLVGLAFYWSAIRWRELAGAPRLSRHVYRRVASGAGRIFVGAFPGFTGERLDNVLVAATLGTTLLSFYALAWNASRVIVTVFLRLARSVLIPTFSQLTLERARLDRAVALSFEFGAAAVIPATALLSTGAPSLVLVVLGPKWRDVIPCLQVLALAMLSAPALATSGALLMATGRAQLAIVASGALIVVQLLIIPTFSRHWGTVGAAVADLVATSTLTAIHVLLVRHHYSVGLWLRFVVLLLAGAVAALAAATVVAFMAPGVICLAVQAAVVAAVYAAMLALFGRRDLLDGAWAFISGRAGVA